MGAQNKAGARCCEISRRRRWRCPTFKRLPPCHSGPWRARAVPLELQDLKPRRAPGSVGVRRPTVSASAPRFLAAGRRYRQPEPPGPRLRPCRPSTMPGRAWSSLVFAGLVGFRVRAARFDQVGRGQEGKGAANHDQRGTGHEEEPEVPESEVLHS
eukprot:scaffold63483_cov69-Phaeocystis_antarctica.AAC.4